MDNKAIHFDQKKLEQPSALKLLWTSLLFQVKEFFNNSTLHGVRYIAEPGRPFFEKFMWFCLVAIGVVAAFVIIASLWEKFQTNPTITGLDTDFQSQQIFFPTVIVCPTEPFDEDKVKEVAEQLHETESEKFVPFLQSLTRLSYETMADAHTTSLNVTDEKSMDKIDLRKLMYSTSINCNETFAWCKFKGEEIDCCRYFWPVYNEQGYCFGFNSRYTYADSVEQKFEDMMDLFETDKKWALTFDLTLQSRVFVLSFEENIGYDYRAQMTWDINYAAELSISMKMTYTTDDARQLSVGQRKCIFRDEVKPQYYINDHYTFSGCMKECRIKKSLKFCKCLAPFYRPTATSQLPQCGVKDIGCLAKYATNITDIRSCGHCELPCDMTVYDIEKFSKTMKPENSKINKEEDSHVNVEYLTWPIIRYKREVLFGWVDLLVSFGGIAGLFLGFSLLSGVEIIYYFTMRALCMLYKNKDELYDIEKEKKMVPPVKYDLSLKPKFGLRPLTAGVRNRGVETPTLNIITEHEILNDAEMDRIKRFKQFNPAKFKRQNPFKTMQVAPYSQNIKPLDKKFQANADEPFFFGYLP